MDHEKYVEISSKALKAEATVKKAIDQFESELANIFQKYQKRTWPSGCRRLRTMTRSVSWCSTRPSMDGEQAILRKSERCQ